MYLTKDMEEEATEDIKEQMNKEQMIKVLEQYEYFLDN